MYCFRVTSNIIVAMYRDGSQQTKGVRVKFTRTHLHTNINQFDMEMTSLLKQSIKIAHLTLIFICNCSRTESLKKNRKKKFKFVPPFHFFRF
mgnify:CR=1 FL=1